MIVGIANSGLSGENGGQRAFRWTEPTGAEIVEDWLRGDGATIASNTTREAFGVSADGTIVVGSTQEGDVFIARSNGSTGDGDGSGSTGDGDGSGSTGDGDGSGSTGDGDGSGSTGDGDGSGSTGDGDGSGSAGDGDGSGSAGDGDGTGSTGDGVGDSGSGDSEPDSDPVSEPGMITIGDLTKSLNSTAVSQSVALTNLSTILNGAGSRPLDRRAATGRSLIWLGGDLGRDDHDVRDGAFGLVEGGLGHNFGGWQLNGAVGYTSGDQNTALGGETQTDAWYVKAELLTQLAGTESRGLWAVITASGLWGEADIDRRYIANGGLTDRSVGSADIDGYGVRARLQADNIVQNISPYGEVSYSKACRDGYRETSGAFPVSFNSLCDDVTVVRLGSDISVSLSDTLRLLGIVEGAYQFEDSQAGLSGDVIGLGSFNLPGATVKQEWLRSGIGLEVDLSTSATLSFTANATTRGPAASTWFAASLKKRF